MNPSLSQANLTAMRQDISRRQLINGIFAVVGLLVIFISIFILMGLVIQMTLQGLPRITPSFSRLFLVANPKKLAFFLLG